MFERAEDRTRWEAAVAGQLDAEALWARFPDGHAGSSPRSVRLSERDLAKLLGVSQPTTHRVKRSLLVRFRSLAP